MDPALRQKGKQRALGPWQTAPQLYQTIRLSGHRTSAIFSLSSYPSPVITVALCTIKPRPNEHCIQYLQPEIGPSSDRDRDLSKTNECS